VSLYARTADAYARYRAEDPRIAAAIHAALGDARTVINVGAGQGAYEPRDREVTAVEPEPAMIAARATPAIQASAEALPFADDSFDAAMAVLTIHHWTDWRAGVRELRRVARDRVVIFTHDSRHNRSLWLVDEYLPELVDFALPPPEDVLPDAEIEVVEIPHDCQDGFLCAYWRRPERYLDPDAQRAISALATLDPAVLARGMTKLTQDLQSGAWARRHADLLDRLALDLGYRLLVARHN
jgi:SAM-dependent methyltransferase